MNEKIIEPKVSLELHPLLPKSVPQKIIKSNFKLSSLKLQYRSCSSITRLDEIKSSSLIIQKPG